MSLLFRVKVEPEDKKPTLFEPQGLPGSMDRTRERMRVWGGPWRQRTRGQDWGPWRTDFEDTASRFRERLKGFDNVGDVGVIEAQNAGLIIVRKMEIVEVDFPSFPATCTDRVKDLVHELWTEFPQLESWGIYNCRKIDGSSRWSEHSWGDAIDPHSGTTYMDRAVAWGKRNAERLHITRILWRVSGHWDHSHWDMDPDHSSTPPCT